jgi:hypothetical protein
MYFHQRITPSIISNFWGNCVAISTQAVVRGDGAGNGSRLDELRPRADDGDNFHACFKTQLGLGTSDLLITALYFMKEFLFMRQER